MHDGELDLLINLCLQIYQMIKFDLLDDQTVGRAWIVPTSATMNARMVQMLGLLWMKLVVPSEIEHSSSVVILRGVIKKQREKNQDERKTYRVDHPGWLLRQLALDSPSCTFLADEP